MYMCVHTYICQSVWAGYRIYMCIVWCSPASHQLLYNIIPLLFWKVIVLHDNLCVRLRFYSGCLHVQMVSIHSCAPSFTQVLASPLHNYQGSPPSFGMQSGLITYCVISLYICTSIFHPLKPTYFLSCTHKWPRGSRWHDAAILLLCR
jgi:hypothetical protein